MTVQDIRYQNTLRLLAERKLKLKEFAELLGKSPAQVSAFAGRNPHKKIGEQVAREIEKAFNIPKGALDFPARPLHGPFMPQGPSPIPQRGLF